MSATRISHRIVRRFVTLLAIGAAAALAAGCGGALTVANYNTAIQGVATQVGADVSSNAWSILGVKNLAANVPVVGPSAATAARSTLASAISQGIRNLFLTVVPSVDTQRN